MANKDSNHVPHLPHLLLFPHRQGTRQGRPLQRRRQSKSIYFKSRSIHNIHFLSAITSNSNNSNMRADIGSIESSSALQHCPFFTD